MYRQELPANPNSALAHITETYIANTLQLDLSEVLGITLPVFIQNYAEKFRTLFDAHPEWRELFLRDKSTLVEMIVQELGETMH